MFVPPFAIGKVPVTPVVKGNPVTFVIVPLVGVPRLGVIRVGEVAKTNEPEPVSSLIAVANCAEVPVKVLEPNEIDLFVSVSVLEIVGTSTPPN